MKTAWILAATLVALLAAAPSYAADLSAGLSDVALAKSEAPAKAEKDDGSSFTLRPDYASKDIFAVYERLGANQENQFVTTDVALHAGHLLFDYSLRAVEIEKLYGRADKLTKAMVEASQSRLAATAAMRLPTPDYPNDLRAILAFFCVPAKILDPKFEVPAEVKDLVEKDLAAMEKHEGFDFSATLDSKEDFSQYIVRGHYTRNEEFKRYFKAMMWYGRRMYRVEETGPESIPGGDHWSDAHRLAETRQMIMITQMLYTVQIDNKPAIDTWNALYIPTVLFAGRTEDLNPMEVKALAEKVWNGWPKSLADKEVLEFAKQAAAFSHPKIDSSGAGRKGFCFMAQRFTPDSYLFQCLVTEGNRTFGDGVPKHILAYTGSRDPKPFTWGINRYMTPPQRRFMPRGLDVLAVLGCDEALSILKTDGDTEYEDYDAMLAFLRHDVGKLMATHKDENLYYGWLYALQPMLKPLSSDKVPACLRSEGWLHKQMNTSLASWAELRHDTILYVKQSYTPTAESAKPQPHYYVEPQPEVFRRMARMVLKMRKDLGDMGVMPEGLEKNYERFAAVCEKLAAVADKELQGEALTPEDQAAAAQAARELKASTELPEALQKKIASEADSNMALVADVHTDTNAGVCLEECVGSPLALEVKMKIGDRMETLRGAAFSYYEFKHPMKDRLTDEAWQKMLSNEKDRPALPTWVPAEMK
jgi:hypothetical protein